MSSVGFAGFAYDFVGSTVVAVNEAATSHTWTPMARNASPIWKPGHGNCGRGLATGLPVLSIPQLPGAAAIAGSVLNPRPRTKRLRLPAPRRIQFVIAPVAPLSGPLR